MSLLAAYPGSDLHLTGYKLRKHIAKALQARSAGIRGALKTYNAAAAAMCPPRRSLKWDEVVEYAFLADFDLLRDAAKISEVRPWATPAARALLDNHFKIERAHEEIKRCNIEIRRLITHIRDEKVFLTTKIKELDESDPTLAYFIRQYQWVRGRFDKTHIARFQKLAAKAGARFTGTLEPGKRLPADDPEEPAAAMDGVEDTTRVDAEAATLALVKEMEQVALSEDTPDEDQGEVADGKEIAELLYTVFKTVTDKGNTSGEMEDE